MVSGLRVSSPIQAFLELATTLDLVDLVVLGDSLVKRNRFAPDELVTAASRWAGNGAARARKAAALVRKGVDSPRETRLRMLLVLAGLPEPTVNVIIRNPDGSWRMRFDLCYLDQRLIVEYDGRQHADSPQQWERDIYRREQLDRMDYRLLIVTSRGVFNEPHRTLERVRDALRERGARVPTRFKNEWRRHFPTTA